MSSFASLPRPPAPSSPPFSLPSASTSSPDASRHNGLSPGGRLDRATPRTLADSGRNTNNFAVTPSNRMGTTVNKIEQIMENLLDNVNRGKELSIPFTRRANPRSNQSQSQGNDTARQQPRGFVSFPGKTEAESKLFSGHPIPLTFFWKPLSQTLDATCHVMISSFANRRVPV